MARREWLAAARMCSVDLNTGEPHQTLFDRRVADLSDSYVAHVRQEPLYVAS
jgi:hypothetical protein